MPVRFCLNRNIVLGLVFAITTTVSSGLIAISPADADPHPTHSGVVSADPADHTPQVLSGHVNAFAQVGDQMIVGGSFSQVESGGVVYERSNLFSFDVVTGEISTTFAPHAKGEVFDLQVTPSHSYVIAVGSFTSIDSRPKTQRVAALKVTDGSVLTSFQPPAFNNTVRDIAYAHHRYYVTGDFSKAGTASRTGLASLAAMGKLTKHAKLKVTETANGKPGASKVRTADVSPNGRWMVIAGNFGAVSGQRRQQIALLKLTARTTRLSPWSTNAYAPNCQKNFNTYMRDVAFSPESAYFVAVTTGGPLGFQSSGRMCDTAARWRVSNKAGQTPAWVNYTGGDTLTAVIVDRRVVYVGGHQRWLNNSYGHNSAAAGAVSRSGIAALDPANGLPISWNPGRARGYGVFGFALTSQGLWVGSDTVSLGGEQHARLGLFPSAGGTSLPAYATAGVPGRLLQLGAKETDKVSSRTFDGDGVGAAKSVATTTAWSRVRGAFVVDQTLYSAWTDGTLRAAPLSSGPLARGPAINLNGAFSDLASVRSMFFDRTTRRLYYTLAGSNALYYRYFQPESSIVGSWRYRVDDRNMKWSGVRGSFLVGSRLYYVDKVSGHLHSVKWQPVGRTVGKSNAVGGDRLRSAATVLTPKS
jgi:hypothetical protein